MWRKREIGKIMTKNEALQKALDALGPTPPDCCGCQEEWQIAIDAIKEALAQPDPYAKGYADAMNWKVQNHLEHLPAAQKLSEWKLVPREATREMLEAMDECSIEGYDEHLYAGHAASVYMAAVDVAPTPPQRKPLTDEEIYDIRLDAWVENRQNNKGVAFYIKEKK